MNDKPLISRILSRLLYYFTKYGQPFMDPIEKSIIRKHERETLLFPPVFIIGAPRTGSTILYEYITHFFSVAYINNFMSRFFKTLNVGASFSRLLFHDRPHHCFDSKYGSTEGWNSPSECGQFWYRWFPVDRHFVDTGELTMEQIGEIQGILKALVNTWKRPIILKNLNCGQRLRAIAEIFPEALFLYCKRNPLYTAQSIIESREKLFNDRSTWWTVMPKEYKELVKLDYPEQIVKQIFFLQKQIESDLTLFDREQWIEIWYEDFCKSPKQALEKVRSLAVRNGFTVDYKTAMNEHQIPLSQQQRIDKNTFEKLNEWVQNLTWSS